MLHVRACGLVVTVLMLLAGGCANQRVEPAQLGSVERLHVADKCYLASQPAAEDFAAFKARGVTTVLNLRPPGEQKDFNEKQLVESLGMRYINLPVSGADDLTDEVLDEARRILRQADGDLLVHCSSANRVGAIWLAHRVLDHGVSYDEALAEAKTVGLRVPALEERARQYIEAHRAG